MLTFLGREAFLDSADTDASYRENSRETGGRGHENGGQLDQHRSAPVDGPALALNPIMLNQRRERTAHTRCCCLRWRLFCLLTIRW